MDNILKKFEFSLTWTRFIFSFFGYLTILGVLFGIFLIVKYSDLFPIFIQENSWEVSLTIGQFVVAALLLRLIMLYFRRERRIESITLPIVYISAAIMAVILSEDLKGTDIQAWDSIRRFLPDDIFPSSILNQVLIQFTLIVFVLQLVKLQGQWEKSRASLIVSAITAILGVSFVIFLFLFTSGYTLAGGETNTGYENLIVLITAISGLITAISALYGQMLAGKKLNAEIELLKAQNQPSKSSTRINKKPGKKVTKKPGKK